MSLLDSNTYYKTGNIVIFPSANAVDSGKLFTEENGRNITKNITKLNYVINPGDYNLSFTPDEVTIQPGKAIINGFEVTTDTTLNYRLPSAEEITASDELSEYKNYALLCLKTNFDSNSNIFGNITVDDVWYCGGISVGYVSAEDYLKSSENYLLLGGVDTVGNIKENISKYQNISAKDILITLEPDPETKVPPEQSVGLLDFINNYLHGYWFSKAGDNIYGPVIFKQAPTTYKETGFDYTTEDLLSSSKYDAKIQSVKSSVDNRTYGRLELKNTVNNKSDGITEIEPKHIILSTAENVTYSFEIDETNKQLNLICAGPANKGVSIPLNFSNFTLDRINSTVFVENRSNPNANVTNYLIDNSNNITTTIGIEGKSVSLSAQNVNTKYTLNSEEQVSIGIKAKASDTWTNIASVDNNLEVEKSAYVKGYIAAGDFGSDPSTIKVPNGTGDTRPIQEGDIYAKQVWGAVYNDYAEIFDLDDNISANDVIGLVLAYDEFTEKCVIADKKHKNIVGVVSENPGFCTGGAGCLNGVPVALSGRVKVKYSGKIKPGYYVGLNNKFAGTVKKCRKNSKYYCGKVLRIIDKDFIEILVK